MKTIVRVPNGSGRAMVPRTPVSRAIREHLGAIEAVERRELILADVVRGPVEDDAPRAETDEAREALPRELEVVQAHAERQVALLRDLREERHRVARARRVDAAHRLVREQRGGILEERACDRDALLLAAGEAVRALVELFRDNRSKRKTSFI
jgi:uroporphyrinogen-III synthase